MILERLVPSGDGGGPGFGAALTEAMEITACGGFLPLACQALRIGAAVVCALALTRGQPLMPGSSPLQGCGPRRSIRPVKQLTFGIRHVRTCSFWCASVMHFTYRFVESLRVDALFGRLVSVVGFDLVGRVT